MSTSCIIFMTHRTDAVARDALRHLIGSIGESAPDIFVLLDSNTSPEGLVEIIDPAFIWPFNTADLATRYNFFKTENSPTLVPGNTIFPLLDFAQHNHYSFYWLVEYDVRFSGDWSTLISRFDDCDADLLGTTLFRKPFRPGWNWWSSLRTPAFSFLKDRDRIRGLFPVIRLSNTAVDELVKGYRKGWRGHYEVVVPTLLNHKGLSIRDIGGSGEFVDATDVNRFYTNSPQNPLLAPGTFVCPPATPSNTEGRDLLFHAVK